MLNEITLQSDRAFIRLRGQWARYVVTVDLDSLANLQEFDKSWCGAENNDGSIYAVAEHEGTTIQMHRFLTNAPTGTSVDHLNHNTLDNRLSNLRVGTQRENTWNPKRAVGVFQMPNGSWRATFTMTFRTEGEARAARATWEGLCRTPEFMEACTKELTHE